MNKKGFTIVELMAVLVVLTIIILIAVPVYSKVNITFKQKNSQNEQQIIKAAAEKYAEDYNVSAVYVKDLIQYGYIEPNKNDDSIVDPYLNNNWNCEIVTIETKNSLKVASFTPPIVENAKLSNVLDDGTCDVNVITELNGTIYIEATTTRNGDKVLVYNNNKNNGKKDLKDYDYWTSNDVELSVKTMEDSNINLEGASATWYVGTKEVGNGLSFSVSAKDKMVLQQLYKVEIIPKDSDKKYTTSIYVKIDTISPNYYSDDKINKQDSLNNEDGKINWKQSKTYTPKIYDNESGVYGYKVYLNYNNDGNTNSSKEYEEFSGECPKDIGKYTKGKKITFEKNGTYKFCIMDNAGNVKESEAFEVNSIDNVAPKCSSYQIVDNESGWTKNDVTITAKCIATENKDNECGANEYKVVTYNTGSIAIDKTDYEFEVKDKAGNNTVCKVSQTKRRDSDPQDPSKPIEIKVYHDKVAPECTNNGGGTTWTNNDVTINGVCSDSGSGCKSNATKTYTETANLDNQSPGVIEDNVGNKTTCPSDRSIRIDKIAPTCESSGGSTAWTTTSRTLNGKCSDKGGSGCAQDATYLINWQGNWSALSPGNVKDVAGNITECPSNQTVKIEKDITAPVYSSASSSYDSITVSYSAGYAYSGIASTNCYLTNSSGGVLSSGTVSGNNCVFSVTPTSSNTTYYYKKCITSNAGQTSCSSVGATNNVGYCTSGNFYGSDSYAASGNWGGCSASCGGGTQYRNATKTTTYISNYQSYGCGSSSSTVGNYYSQSCNTRGCCSSVYAANYGGQYTIAHDQYKNDGSYPSTVVQYRTYCQPLVNVSNYNGQWCSGIYLRYCSGSGGSGSCGYYSSSDCSWRQYVGFFGGNSYNYASYYTSWQDAARWHVDTFGGVSVYDYGDGAYYNDGGRNVHDWYNV